MKAYDVEDRVFGRRKQPLSMVDSLDLASKLFAHFGVEPIEVKRSRQKQRGASFFGHPFKGRPAFIRLASHAPDWVVCHEVAHYVDWCRVGNDATTDNGARTGHTPGWAALYVEAVRLTISETYADRLRAGFAKARLRNNWTRKVKDASR